MTELNLRRTWPEVFKYLSTSPNPLRITEMINRVRPCCWTFRFTFDNTGRTAVRIDCDRTISNNDARALLDGSLEEIFFADTVSFCQTGKYHTVNTSKLFKSPPHSNQVIFRDHLDKKADSLLTLKGFWRSNTIPPELQKNSSVCSYLLENTWLGSPGFEGATYCIRWIVFGTEYTIQPQNRYKDRLGSTADFTMRKNLYDTNRNHIGHATFYTSPSLKKNELYTVFGPVDPEKEDWLITKNKDPYWIVEIGSEALKQTIIRGGHTRKLINQLVDSLENARISVTESDSFQDYKRKMLWKRESKAADVLRDRQERARSGPRVTFNGKPVMLIPSNENEVLLMLAKLEALNALPFHEFILWEYTSRTGIDAIVSYQIKEIDAQSMFVPTELEYHFENFDDHGHPYHQVNLVICWNFRNAETPAKLHKYNEWLYEYRNDTSVLVVVLSRIPNLQIEEN